MDGRSGDCPDAARRCGTGSCRCTERFSRLNRGAGIGGADHLGGQRRRRGRKGIADGGISTNRVLTGGFGQSALARFDRDVLDQPGVLTVIVLEGINDINTGSTADELIAGYRNLLRRAHADNNTCIVGGTLTPDEGGNADREAQRQAVNEFVRTSGEFDGVVDFDAAVRYPGNPSDFLPACDSGDGLHPSDAGYQAMASAVPLGLLDCGR